MDYYISSIMGWGPSWAPRNWALCAGQLLAISTNTAVFSLIGTTYGGDGRTSFKLPDLRGRAPVGAGQGTGTSFHPLGSIQGQETQTLTVLEMPNHTHTVNSNNLSSTISASTSNGSSNTPAASNVMAKGFVAASGPGTGSATEIYTDASNADTTLHGGPVTGNIQLGSTGGSQPFSIVQPIQAIQFIFCLVGIFPSRN
ncbi:phage tail protein [Gracilimonas mengyeensis]|uniref:Microcystin-dependent protein n=1 Tax=Gracilimonas mengyeensis TaxID=1302730 RepID=A0A521CL64_9BACT|nr:tail fiber protein [Gracilimonas mengyeensis]SMO60186.1 Microcystin-dependent protein [Gracilimonas mengyeensis]